MQNKTLDRQIQVEGEVLELARLLSESVVAAVSAVAQAILEAVAVFS